MRSPIPKAIREQLSDDPFMTRCCVADATCLGYIQWHHGLTYAGQRQNELWAILPVCESHHRREAQYRDELEFAMSARIFAFDAEADAEYKYPRRNWKRLLPFKRLRPKTI